MKTPKYKLIVKKIDFSGDLLSLGDQFRNKLKKSGVALIGTIYNNKPMVMCAVTDDLTNKIMAEKIVQEVGIIIGGGGGGKPHLATAGGNKIEKLDEALRNGKEIIKILINQEK